MNQKQRNAWIEAAKEQVLKNAKKTDGCEAELMMLYDECAYSLEKEIRAFYQKFAKDNQLSEAEAGQLLSGKEWSSWRKTIEGYLSEIDESGKDSKIALELNTLAAKTQLSRKEQLLSNVYHNMAQLAGRSEKELDSLLSDLVRTNYDRKSYDLQNILKVGFTVGKVDEQMLRGILEFPWSGERFSKRIWGNTDKLAALARREITYGFMAGSSVDKMTDIIAKEMQTGRYQARRLVRTESIYFANQGQMAAYKQAGIRKYQWLGGGCEDCARLNGMVFDVDAAIAGENLPPLHPNCKCTTIAASDIPVFKKRYADPLKDNPKFAEWKMRYQEEDDAYGEDEERGSRKNGFFTGFKAKQEAKKLLKPYAAQVEIAGNVDLRLYEQAASEIEKQLPLTGLRRLDAIRIFDNEDEPGRMASAVNKSLLISTRAMTDNEWYYRRTVQAWKKKNEEGLKIWKRRMRDEAVRRDTEKLAEAQKQYAERLENSKYFRSNVLYKDHTIENLVQHEMMHIMLNAKKLRDDKVLRQCYDRAMQSGDIYKISKRASANEREFAAEAHVMYENGEPLPDYISSLIRSIRSYGIE